MTGDPQKASAIALNQV